MVSESDISIQGHGVHTAYTELASALERRDDIDLIRGAFGETVSCDIVHIHTIGPRTWRKLLQKSPKKVISAHVVPASLIGSIAFARYWSFVAGWYMKWLYGRADKVLAVSETVAEVLKRDLGVRRDAVEVFYNTIDMAQYRTTSAEKRAARKKLGIAPGAFVVLGNGQVQPRKRVDTFHAMAAALPDVTFMWVGGIPFKQLGADYAAMQKLSTETPENLTVTGSIPHEDVAVYLAAADVFCLPAEQENHPMCVLEAAGAGLPIILRDIPEYHDTFGDDAVLCRSDEEFTEAVTMLQDATHRKQWRATSSRIAERFDSHVAAGRLVELYRSLL